MGDEEPLEFAVRGVVRNGQVVLDTPLDVPDGTVVTVKEYDKSDYPPVFTPPTEEQLRWLKSDIARLQERARNRAAGGQPRQDAA
jgi:hypothetical protein